MIILGKGNDMDVREVDELDKKKALNYLSVRLQEAETSVIAEGTISADELEKELGRVITSVLL